MKRKIYILIILMLIIHNICFAKTNINIIPGDNITNEQINTTITAVRSTIKYMKNTFDIEINRNITINIAYTSSELPDMYDENDINTKIGGKSYRGKINILLNQNPSNYHIIFLVAHEMIHQYQLNVVDFSTLNKNMWFTEGMADVLAVKIANEIIPNVENLFRENMFKNNNDSIELKDITNKQGWSVNFNNNKNTYSKSDLAIFYLVDNYGYSLLFDYLNNLYFDNASIALLKTYKITINDLDKIIY